MRINHNISSLNTYNRLTGNTQASSKSLEKLSSGLRINRASDDAAGLAISEKMRGQIRGLAQAQRNAQDGISMIQTTEGALNETHSILQRMRELSVQSANDTNTAGDRKNIQGEVDQLLKEIDRIGDTTEFNTRKLLNGDLGSAVSTPSYDILKSTSFTAAAGTAAAAGTSLVELYDKASNDLGIATGDTIVIEGRQGDTFKSVTLTVADNTSLAEILSAISATFGGGSAAYTVNANGTFNITGSNGFANALGGLTISVKDTSGNIRNAATNALSDLTKTQNAADARADGTISFFIGANGGQSIAINVDDMRATSLGVKNLRVETQSQANNAIKVLDAAIVKVSAQRSDLGAIQNRLEHTINNLGTAEENLTASESRIRDVDMAKEMMDFTKNNILTQAATSMLAQSNQSPQGVLQLLR